MDEIIISRGSGKSAFTYLVRLHDLYKSGKISEIDYLSMFWAVLVFLFRMSEENALNLITKKF